MTLFQFFSQWKSKSETHRDVHEYAYIEGYSNGFESGLKMASEIDKIVINKAKEVAIDETLRRLNGSNKKNN